MRIDEHLKEFRTPSLPPGLRSRVLAASPMASPWRRWLRAAAGIVIASSVVLTNVQLEVRLARQLKPPGDRKGEASTVWPAASASSFGGVIGRGAARSGPHGPTWAALRRQGLPRRT